MNLPKFATGHGYCMNCGRSLFECDCHVAVPITPEIIHDVYAKMQNAYPVAEWVAVTVAERQRKIAEQTKQREKRRRQLRFALWLVLIALVALIVFNIVLSINSYLDTRIAQRERDMQLRSNVLKVMENE